MLQRLSSLTFRSQLLLVFGALLSVVLLAALLSLGRLGAVDTAGRKIDDRTRPYSAALWAAAVDLKAMANDERGLLMTGDAKFHEEIQAKAKSIRSEFERAGQMSAHAEDRKKVAAIAEKVDRWIAAIEKEFELARTDHDAAVEVALGENRDLRKSYEEDLKGALADADADLVTSLADMQAETSGTRTTLLVALLIVALVAVAGGLWMELRTRRRLASLVARLRSLDEHCATELAAGLQSMAHGDLTQTVTPVTEPVEDAARDDIGVASDTTNALIAKFRGAVESYNSTRGQLSTMIGEIAGSSLALSSASQQMASTSDEAGRAVGEIASAVGEVAMGAERQVRMVESTRNAVQEAARAAVLSSETAQATTLAAQDAKRAADEGIEAAEHATDAIRHVAESSDEIAAAIEELAQRSARIGEFVATITGIAEQTNLLALNAAIVAARAGEQGKGFAVVAEEVRKLAEESQQSAAEIAGLVGEIQAETSRVVDVVAAGSQRTEDGVSTVRRTREAFVGIGTAIETMGDRVAEIAAAVQRISEEAERAESDVSEVASVAEESSASAEQVSASTEETSASTQEIAASAQTLAGTAEQLNSLVGRFTVAR